MFTRQTSTPLINHLPLGPPSILGSVVMLCYVTVCLLLCSKNCVHLNILADVNRLLVPSSEGGDEGLILRG